jgi:DNA topoisomerase-1
VRTYKTKAKNAQEAHEAIRPTHVVTSELNGGGEDSLENKVYRMIWKRTVASQMASSEWKLTTVTIGISCREETFIAKIEILLFDGYRKVYQEFKEEEEEDLNTFDGKEFHVGQICLMEKIESHEKWKPPPVRYNESSMIKKMEKEGIGRPSTYASVMEKLFSKNYIEISNAEGSKTKTYVLSMGPPRQEIQERAVEIQYGEEKKKFFSTEGGRRTSSFLEHHFPTLFQVPFTKEMEEKLDQIATHHTVWHETVQTFYDMFHPHVAQLKEVSIEKKEYKRVVGETETHIVSVYHGKYGPVIEKKEKKHPRKKPVFIKLPECYDVATVQMEEIRALEVQREENPIDKMVGEWENEKIILKHGIYGYYLSYKKKNYSLSSLKNPIGISMEEALSVLQRPQTPKPRYTKKTKEILK